MKELKIDAKIENLGAVLKFIAAEVEAAGCSVKLQTQIAIAAEEIFVNIARYAYFPKKGGAIIRISAGDDVSIEFEDGGKAYNPLEKAAPDITLSAEERDIGGLGIFMVKNLMDAVEYRREGYRNILLIKKTMIL